MDAEYPMDPKPRRTRIDAIRERVLRGEWEMDDTLLLLAALDHCVEALPDVPEHCGSHTHLGMHIDHKDCDAIREARQFVKDTLECEERA